MGKFDNDSDGLLDIDEFKSLMNKNQKKKDVWMPVYICVYLFHIHAFQPSYKLSFHTIYPNYIITILSILENSISTLLPLVFHDENVQ